MKTCASTASYTIRSDRQPAPSGRISSGGSSLLSEKHADANSVRIVLHRDARKIRLAVEDDGRGFDASAMLAGDGSGGAGLMIMRERAIALDARFEVHSRPGGGTRVECELATTR